MGIGCHKKVARISSQKIQKVVKTRKTTTIEPPNAKFSTRDVKKYKSKKTHMQRCFPRNWSFIFYMNHDCVMLHVSCLGNKWVGQTQNMGGVGVTCKNPNYEFVDPKSICMLEIKSQTKTIMDKLKHKCVRTSWLLHMLQTLYMANELALQQLHAIVNIHTSDPQSHAPK